MLSKQFIKTATAGAIGALVLAGCGSSGSDGEEEIITEIVLPNDLELDLACADAGIAGETCILEDPDNPFRSIIIREFDVNNPGAENKFDIANSIPDGQEYAKARFYFWATALARRPSGENQYATAQALHELLDAQILAESNPAYLGDPNIRAQALRAYRSVLENFFGSVTFFVFSYEINGEVVFCDPNRFVCPPPGFDPERGDREIPVSFVLNELTADALYREEATGWTRLIPGDPILTLEEISDWGFTYTPCVEVTLPDGAVVCQGGTIAVSEF